mmetsp:Transcript_35156/g.48018  ORF Transcript_35156/g.48018 Transcript_35156/m.48018 type:complete len:189 (-) Transcript_35156:37-603(-)|eukprot:CAMPEP_0201486022 /NCGR_PEP_ID=MMETSP0151_2-20130828/10077_1 /ASSEMBLY_ACC=CAM_ASM_000257 /TAXON_ID=200890 /ORGANISM="Paramoeba atlantica, Strain 621/1 / CCAP 1560/9" /LENGTH=188 /DNA_ID=CAMNT_0047870397 /DNA_START=74 /DNA_END=640 /DNA_ORIENTATION=+
MAAPRTTRKKPNILITGTPGVGKSTLAETVSSSTGFRFVNVGDLIERLHLYSEKDDQRDCTIFDEDPLLDEMEIMLQDGGNIVDFHSCDFFPERWFDLVIVLRSDTEILYQRLEERGYPLKKVQENVQAEILQVVLDEAAESYKKEIIWVLPNNNADDMEKNTTQMTEWIEKRLQGNSGSGGVKKPHR